MVKGKTGSGFAFEVDPEIMKDVDFLELMVAAEKGNDESVGAFFDANRMMLGADQYEALKDHLREKKGKVILEDLTDAMTDIMNAVNDADNDVKN